MAEQLERLLYNSLDFASLSWRDLNDLAQVEISQMGLHVFYSIFFPV